ncbi:MAG: hypothetical protein B1H03_04445 [Planctomycetales bacterium 4484_113]|nr:MAG: hypothetical protein B1H03_04445 [Planctomycetales bacterium 4484_113]
MKESNAWKAVILLAFAVIISTSGAYALNSSEEQPMLSKDSIEKLEKLIENSKIPKSAVILNKTRSEHPFQGAPFDAVYSKHIPKEWKHLSDHEKMLAWGWVNPAAEDYSAMSREERGSFIKEHPTRESRGWGRWSFDPISRVQEMVLTFYADTGKMPQTTYELLAHANYGKAIANADVDNPGELLLDFISPVTGQLIDFTKKEFSPGNMYIQLIETEELAKYDKHSKVQMMDGSFLPFSQAYKVLFYYRVYGKSGIIRTGSFGITTDGALGLN